VRRSLIVILLSSTAFSIASWVHDRSPARPHSLAVHPSGRRLAIACTNAGSNANGPVVDGGINATWQFNVSGAVQLPLGIRAGLNLFGRQGFPVPYWIKVDAFQEICREIGQAPADVAMAWVAGRPGVTAPICGPRTLAQLQSSVAALQIKLDDETLGKLDTLFPGPGGTAPEAYAW